ncbi:MAG: hypothetical protein DHS20C11_11700 [Lysobacteraceae bacterium]|nr:MAG: hypothetical protein DHS20C11_11700 [Xanthomonadaceae bacterium]
MKAIATTILATTLLGLAHAAQAGCNAQACYNMDIEQYRVQANGLYFVTTDDAALASITACRVQRVTFGVGRPAIFLHKDWATYDAVKEALLLSKMMGEQVSFAVADNPDTTWDFCEFNWVIVQETPAS